MLRKLLKYDIKSIWRVWWIMAIVVVAAEIIGALCVRGYTGMSVLNTQALSNTEELIVTITGIISMIGIMVSFFAILASFIVTEILIFIRYYKNFFSDEGYLTFTLPVNRRTHLLSKTVNAMIWAAAQIGLMIVGLFIFILIAPTPEKGFITLEGYRVFGRFISEIWAAIGGWLIAYIFGYIFAVLCVAFFQVSLVFLCITVGSVIARRRKVLVGIGLYMGSTTVLSSVTELLFLFNISFLSIGLTRLLMGATLTQGCAVIFLIMLIACAVILTVALTFWSITMNCIRRRLNLA